MNDEEIIHFAGPTMTFGAMRRQRCLWCGALIQEHNLDAIAMPEAGRKPEHRGKPIQDDEIGHWSGLVAVSGTNPRMYRAVDDPDDGKAPDRSCMVLLPEEIAIMTPDVAAPPPPLEPTADEVIERAAQSVVDACLPLLPLVGSDDGGYRLSEHIHTKIVALPDEWASAAQAVADLHAALSASPTEEKP